MYVGSTGYWHLRKKQHFGGIGSKWTRKHKPLCVVSAERIQGNPDKWEDNKTIECICEKGFANVRGGRWVSASDTFELPIPSDILHFLRCYVVLLSNDNVIAGVEKFEDFPFRYESKYIDSLRERFGGGTKKIRIGYQPTPETAEDWVRRTKRNLFR